MTPEQIIPLAVIPVVLVLVLLRNRRPRVLRPQWMWVVPVLLLTGISAGLYFTPHAPFGPTTYAAFAGALGLAPSSAGGAAKPSPSRRPPTEP